MSSEWNLVYSDDFEGQTSGVTPSGWFYTYSDAATCGEQVVVSNTVTGPYVEAILGFTSGRFGNVVTLPTGSGAILVTKFELLGGPNGYVSDPAGTVYHYATTGLSGSPSVPSGTPEASGSTDAGYSTHTFTLPVRVEEGGKIAFWNEFSNNHIVAHPTYPNGDEYKISGNYGGEFTATTGRVYPYKLYGRYYGDGFHIDDTGLNSSSGSAMLYSRDGAEWFTVQRNLPDAYRRIKVTFTVKHEAPSGSTPICAFQGLFLVGREYEGADDPNGAPPEAAMLRSYIQIGQTFTVYEGGIDLTNLQTFTFGQEYDVEIEADCNKQKFTVTIDGVLYDNGGEGFDFPTYTDGINKIVIHNVTNMSPGESQVSRYDDIKVYEGDSLPFYVFTSPEYPDGLNGWFLDEPSVYILYDGDEDATSGITYYYSLGTYSDIDYYMPISTGSAYDFSTEIPLTALSGYPDKEDIYLWYGPSSGALGMFRYSYPLKWVDNGTDSGVFDVVPYHGSSVSDNDYIPRDGYFVLEGARGYTSDVTTGYPYALSYIDFYANSTKIGRIEFDSDEWHDLSGEIIPSFDWYKYSGSSGTTWSVMSSGHVAARPKNSSSGQYSYYVDINKNSTGSDTIDFNYDIKFGYVSSMLPDSVNSVYAVVVNEAGDKATTDIISKGVPDFKYDVERIGVYRYETSGSSTVIGNVEYNDSIEGIEYTLDRRVPLMHAPIKGGDLNTADGIPPAEVSGPDGSGSPSISTGPYPDEGSNNKSVSITSGAVLDYGNEFISINEGTFECYFKPDSVNFGSGVTSGSERYIFDFARLDSSGSPYLTSDRLSLYYYYTGSSWQVRGRVYDSFGNEYVCAIVPSITGSIGDDWEYVKLTWELNKPLESGLSVYHYSTGGLTSGSTSDGSTITFGILPEYDTYASYLDGLPTVNDKYTNIVVGNSVGKDFSESAEGLFADIRVSDKVQNDTQYGRTSYSGWTTSGVNFNSDTGMFKLDFVLSDNEVEVLKIRPYDVVGGRIRSEKFNSSGCRPVLLRGKYDGVVVGSETVYRFRLIDAQGKFDDLVFTVNPSEFSTEEDSERFSDKISIDGSRGISVAPKPASERSFSWSNITKDFCDKLIERSNSGNNFFLIDHNDNVYFGKFFVSSVDEIVATVPSRYRVSARILGKGSFDEYSVV